MLKKTTAATLVFITLLMLFQTAFARSYSDIPELTPTYEAVDYLSEIGVILGYEDGTFKPKNEITRGEAAAFISRSLGYNDAYAAKSMPFNDVRSGYWAEKFISFCYESGIINGITEDKFGPAEKVTYAQVVKMMVCASRFGAEVEKVSGRNWYVGYIDVAREKGILDNINMEPDMYVPRGDVAIIIYNCFKNGYISLTSPQPTEPTATPQPELNPTPSTSPGAYGEGKIKDKVAYTVPVSDGYKFSASSLNYTPDIRWEEIDFSGLEAVPEDKKLLVVIDPGHNFSGKDIGAHNEKYDVWEQNITWPIGAMLMHKLVAMGFDVVMTRDSYNTNIRGETLTETLTNRTEIANGINADIYVSIHCNAGGGKGVETYCFSRGSDGERLAKAVQAQVVDATGLVNRGVKTAGFLVIKETVMPAILVETAFIDNESDFSFLVSRKGQNQLSTAIANGILQYAKSK